MKRLMGLAIFIAGVVTACSTEEATPAKTIREYTNVAGRITVIVVDSCEYVVYHENTGYAGLGGITHKGNCRYCAERAKQKEASN